jgi:hypothetical protein
MGHPQSGAMREMNWGNAPFFSGTERERDELTAR